MNDMKKETYTLWIDDELVATRNHNRDGYNDLLAYAAEVQGNVLCEIYSSKDEEAVWNNGEGTATPDVDNDGGMAAAEWYDSVCEDYEPNPYDGTYSEI